MELRPAVGSKCGVGILHVCQVKDYNQERSDNNIDCSPSHLAPYIKKTVTVRFILDHPVYMKATVIITCEKKTLPRFELTISLPPKHIKTGTVLVFCKSRRDTCIPLIKPGQTPETRAVWSP